MSFWPEEKSMEDKLNWNFGKIYFRRNLSEIKPTYEIKTNYKIEKTEV